MKKLIVLIAIIFLAQGLQAQECKVCKCKWRENKTDEFTGNTVKRLRPITLYQNLLIRTFMKFELIKIKDSRMIRVKWSTLSIHSFHKGDKIIFLLENGEKAEIEALDYEVASPSGDTWYSSTAFFLGSQAFETLKKANVKKYRIYTPDGYEEKVMHPKTAEKLRIKLNCIQ